ncbi:hypothetical protein Tco_0199556 [Tanacetum coccineum]
MAEQDIPPPTIIAMKIPDLRREKEELAPTTGETSAPLAPKTAKQLIGIDDLYNNLRVYEDEMKRSSGSNSASQNLTFLSSENTSSTNEVSTASGDIGVSTAVGTSQVPSTPCAHDIDGDDLEELDLRWQVAMLSVKVKKKGHFARECRSGRNQRRRSYGDNGRSNAPTNESSSQALVAQDGLGGYDWSNDFEVEPINYALMAISSSSSSSSSDNEVQKCSKQCLESFKTLQKNYDTEREKHNKAKLEIRGYEIALESLESRILGHEKNELAWGEKYEFQNYELKCREIKINNLNLELEKVVKERDELKDKIAKWEESTKNLDEILNSQLSARDKTGLGFSYMLMLPKYFKQLGFTAVMIQVAYLQEDPYSMITKRGRRLQRYDLQLIYVWWHVQGDLDFVSFREMITSQLQGKLWLYDEVRTRLCLFCHHQIGEDCWDS